MRTLPPDCDPILERFASLFTDRLWPRARTLLVGAMLVSGRRTVASVLRVMGLSQERRFKNYHRVLSRARWSALQGGRRLLGLVIDRFVAEGPVLIGLDDTIERRWGPKIRARGIYRDPVRSSRSHFVKVSGLRWLSLMVLAPVPWAERVWALPFLTLLCPSRRYHESVGRDHRRLTDRAAQALGLVKRWVGDRQLVVVADSGYAALEFLVAVSDEQLSVVTRLRIDAALYEPPPPRRPGRPGRPAKRGRRLPRLREVAANRRTRWRALTLSQWYGERDRAIEYGTGTALWYRGGLPPLPIRWVLIRDPLERFEPQALLSTDLEAEAGDIIGWFVQRWQVEVTFAEVRRHLGVESQRQWSDKAIGRTTPVLMGLFSVVTLLADRLTEDGAMPRRTSAWYRKRRATFSDALAQVRRQLWAGEGFSPCASRDDSQKLPTALMARLSDALCHAA